MEGNVRFKYAERQQVCDLISKGSNGLVGPGDMVSVGTSHTNFWLFQAIVENGGNPSGTIDLRTNDTSNTSTITTSHKTA